MTSRGTDRERMQAIAAAKVAARYDIACGGVEVAATLRAIDHRVQAARASSDPAEQALAARIERDLEAAGLHRSDVR